MKYVLIVTPTLTTARHNELFMLVKGRFDEWWHHMATAWIVGVDHVEGSTPHGVVTDWLGRVWKGGTKEYLVVPVDLKRLDALLPEQAWTWIEKAIADAAAPEQAAAPAAPVAPAEPA